MKSKLLCIDPGGTSGISMLEYSDTEAPELVFYTQVEDGLEGFIRFYSDFYTLLKWDKVVCESFTLRTSVKFPDLSPVYIIGALEALSSPKTITYQPPTSKPLCSDDVLKRIGMHLPGKGHANDATRHGIIYLRNQKHMPTLELAWPKEN